MNITISDFPNAPSFRDKGIEPKQELQPITKRSLDNKPNKNYITVSQTARMLKTRASADMQYTLHISKVHRGSTNTGLTTWKAIELIVNLEFNIDLLHSFDVHRVWIYTTWRSINP